MTFHLFSLLQRVNSHVKFRATWSFQLKTCSKENHMLSLTVDVIYPSISSRILFHFFVIYSLESRKRMLSQIYVLFCLFRSLLITFLRAVIRSIDSLMFVSKDHYTRAALSRGSIYT